MKGRNSNHRLQRLTTEGVGMIIKNLMVPLENFSERFKTTLY